MNVKINNGNYEVPELTFKHSKALEKMGVSLDKIVGIESAMTSTAAFVTIVANCTEDEADHLIEQHVMGGGDITDIYNVYIKALKESVFFKKLLNLEEKKTKTAKPTKKEKTTIATEE